MIQTYGYWTVLELQGSDERRNRLALCRCVCGTERVLVLRQLRRGRSKSCGCKRLEFVSTHGHYIGGRASITLSSYRSMVARCYNPKHVGYNRYGGAVPPVTVCPRWLVGEQGFINFVEDMGERPKGKTLGRVLGALQYNKEDCEWQTKAQQARDKKTTLWVTLWGDRYCLAEACDMLKVSYVQVANYLRNGKRTTEEAFAHALFNNYGGKI